MGWLRKSYCSCGSGLEAGFCSHRGATAPGETRGAKRVSGGSTLSRKVTGAPPAGKRKR